MINHVDHVEELRRGFYSESNHLRLSGRTKNGKTRLTKREIRAIMQFCEPGE